jgi:hypothetical protein
MEASPSWRTRMGTSRCRIETGRVRSRTGAPTFGNVPRRVMATLVGRVPTRHEWMRHPDRCCSHGRPSCPLRFRRTSRSRWSASDERAVLTRG